MSPLLLRLIAFFTPYWYAITQWATAPRLFPRVPRYLSAAHIAEQLAYGRRWRKERVDTLTHPLRVQQHIDEHLPIGDCDDHTGYWCMSLHKAELAREVNFGLVYYTNYDGEKEGHAICVFRDIEGRDYWADYHVPVRLLPGRRWFEDVVAQRGKTFRGAVLFPVTVCHDGALSFKKGLVVHSNSL